MCDASIDNASVDPIRKFFRFSLHFCGEFVVDLVVVVLGVSCVETIGVFDGYRRLFFMFSVCVLERFLLWEFDSFL